MSPEKSNFKVFQLLASLSEDELKRLKKFLNSPYFNTNDTVNQLFSYCAPLYPTFPKKKVEKEKIHQVLFPDLEMDEKRIRKLFSKLSGLIEQFLVLEEVQQDQELQRRLLLKGLGRHHLDRFLQRETDQLLRSLKQKAVRGAEYFGDLFSMYQFIASHQLTGKLTFTNEHLNQSLKMLDSYFTLSVYRFYCDFINRRHLLKGQTFSAQYIDRVLELTETHFQKEEDIYKLYFQLANLLQSPQEKALYYSTKDLLLRNFTKIGKTDQQILFYSLLNYVSLVIREFDSTFIHQMIDLYKIGLEYDVFLFSDRMSDTTFINIVMVMAGTRQYKWTEQFIEDYQKYLEPHIQPSAIPLAKAVLLHKQSKFEEVIANLQGVRHVNYSYGLRGRSYLLRSYFEVVIHPDSTIDYTDPLFSLLDSFRRYLDRIKGLPPRRKNSYVLLIKYTRQLLRMKDDPNATRDEKAALIEEIEKTPIIAAQPWLVQKAKELFPA
jgi:hypothetical protein